MCSMSLLKLLKRCARRSMRGNWGVSNKMAEELNLDREGLPNSTTEREIIEHYFHRGYEYKSIVLLLAKYHDLRLSERTLKRKLKDFGLKRREHVDENLEIRVRNIITEELSAGPDRLNGYRSMWHILRLRHHMNVPRQLVASIMKQVDPEGVALRKRRRLHRRTYVFPGPNFAWHVDGYDKLKPYGFSIHGCVDVFSRRVLWLQVQRSNKKPKIIARYFYDYLKATGGCPVRLLTDHGTENGLIAAMQCYLRADGQDEFGGSKAHQYLSSPRNQRIECYWSSLRKLRSSWWIDFLPTCWSQVFWISQMKATRRHCGSASQMFFKEIWIRQESTGTRTG